MPRPTPVIPAHPLDPPPESGDRAATATRPAGPAAGERDRYLDLLRLVAIAAVVTGHWLVIVPSWSDGRFGGTNALGDVPLMRSLTWLFQVMPLFFVVGGVANARSWRGARRKGQPWSSWVGTRLRRLGVPTAWFVATWAVVVAVLRWRGVDPEQIRTIAWVVTVPFWFLAVYVLVVAVAPVLLALHERAGWWVPAVLLSASVVVDALRLAHGTTAITAANFAFVFLFCQQLGYLWLDDRLPRRQTSLVAVGAGALVVMVALVALGVMPLSMVGVPGEAVQNNAPPTTMLALLGVAQLTVALLVRPLVEPHLGRRRVWSTIMAGNAHAMSILVWHLTALVIVAVVALPLGLVPTPEQGGAAWWLLRIVALPLYGIPLVGLLWAFGRVERRSLLDDRGKGSTARWWVAPVAVALFAAGCARIALDGLGATAPGPLGLWILPTPAALVLVATLVARAPEGMRSVFGPGRASRTLTAR